MNCLCDALKSFTNALFLFFEGFSKDALIAVPSIAIAILLPIVVFLIEREKYPFDKSVVFRKVIYFKQIIFIVLANIVFLIIPGDFFLLCAIASSVATIVFTIIATVKTYRWVCSYDDPSDKESYQQKMRINYLNSLKNEPEIAQTWYLLLNNGKLKELNQYGIVDSFIMAANKIETQKDDKEKVGFSLLLNNFCDNLNNIRFTLNDYEKMVKYSLRYYEYEIKFRADSSKEFPPYGMKNLFWGLFKIATTNINDYNLYGYTFFKTINRKCTELKQGQGKFLEIFLVDLFLEFDKNSVDVFRIWNGDFFRRLTVTKEKLTSSDKETRQNTISIFNAYMVYAQKYIQSYSDEKNSKCLEGITEYVFRKIDPIFWFDINTLYGRMFGSIDDNVYHSIVNSWCSNGRDFGLCGRGVSFVSEMATDVSKEEKEKEIRDKLEEINKREQVETIYMLEIIFPWLKNDKEISNMEEGIDFCKKLKTKDELYKTRLNKLEYEFSQIKKYNKEKQKEQ